MAAGDGLVSMTPTSIAHSGTSASINADGGVDFSAVSSLSLNGVFTSDYENYLIVVNYTDTGSNLSKLKLRASGVDSSSDYYRQYLEANGTGVSGARSGPATSGWHFSYTNSTAIGQEWNIYGPYLSQATAGRGVSVSGNTGARLLDAAGTHAVSASYDGFTLIAVTSMSGNIHVFGYEE